MSSLFSHYDVKVVHLEPTDVCNAACPLCARETDKSFDKTKHHHLTVDQISNILSPLDIKQLDKMFMCGNYGDPAAAEYCLEIFKYFRAHNPDIVLGMNTNGSLRSTGWWKELAGILNQPRDYVVFSIDGLEDTNHIYRVNTVWKKLVSNAQAFIDSGGNAHWDMLVYRHNEHQVNQAQDLANQMGFRWFRAKVSKRSLTADLQYPVFWVNKKVTNKTGNIDCIAIKEKSIFISAQGLVSPCCWLGEKSIGIDQFGKVSASWQTDHPEPICNSVCKTISQHKDTTEFKNQWKIEVEFSQL